MNRSLIAATAIVVGLAMFTTDASAQRFGRRRVQSSNQVQHTHVHTQPAAQPATVTPPVAETTPHTTYYPGTAAANVTATPVATAPATTTPADASPTIAAAPAAPVQNTAALMMLERNNQIRASRGMFAMRLSDRLTNAAQHHAQYMARTGQFSHYANGSPQSRAGMFGFGGGVRENIAMGQPSVSSAFQSWTNSSGHYTNMMSHNTAAGFGYATNSSGQGFWVAMYGDE